jgi:hypothetical protein
MDRLIGLVFALAACSTSTTFSGAPKVPHGPKGCAAICQSWDMELVGMIAMGEYSDGCICQVRGARQQAITVATSAAGPALAGVAMQMQHQREQRQRAAAGTSTRR